MTDDPRPMITRRHSIELVDGHGRIIDQALACPLCRRIQGHEPLCLETLANAGVEALTRSIDEPPPPDVNTTEALTGRGSGRAREPLDVGPIAARAAAATPGPWAWRGNMDHEDPRLVGRNRIDEDGRRRFPGSVEVLWSYPRERALDDAGAKEYANYLSETQVADGKGGWRSYTEAEIAERVRDDWLTDQWCEPISDRRMCFTSPECFALDARELAVFEVARAQRLPDDTPRDHPKVYRADIVDVRHPDAEFIAHARADIDALLAEVERLRNRLAAVDALPAAFLETRDRIGGQDRHDPRGAGRRSAWEEAAHRLRVVLAAGR